MTRESMSVGPIQESGSLRHEHGLETSYINITETLDRWKLVRGTFSEKYGEELGPIGIAHADINRWQNGLTRIGAEVISTKEFYPKLGQALAHALNTLEEAERGEWLGNYFTDVDELKRQMQR